jgi:hypothetical protein
LPNFGSFWPPYVSQVIRPRERGELNRHPYHHDAKPEPPMTAIARFVSGASGATVDTRTLGIVVAFCAVGLTVSLLAAFHGVDVSAGFL